MSTPRSTPAPQAPSTFDHARGLWLLAPLLPPSPEEADPFGGLGPDFSRRANEMFLEMAPAGMMEATAVAMAILACWRLHRATHEECDRIAVGTEHDLRIGEAVWLARGRGT